MPFGTEVGIGPCDIVLDGHRAPPTYKGHNSPTFRPMSIVAKRSPVSATAELLLTMRITNFQTTVNNMHLAFLSTGTLDIVTLIRLARLREAAGRLRPQNKHRSAARTKLQQ